MFDPNAVFVPVENTWRKNLYTNILAACNTEGIERIYTVNWPRAFSRPWRTFSRLQLVGYKRGLDLLTTLGSVSAVLAVTLAECQPMTQLEAFALGTPALTGPLELAEFADHELTQLCEVPHLDNPALIFPVSETHHRFAELRSCCTGRDDRGLQPSACPACRGALPDVAGSVTEANAVTTAIPKSICFVTNELFPIQAGGIGRLMYNFAVHNKNLNSDVRIWLLLPSSFAADALPRVEATYADLAVVQRARPLGDRCEQLAQLAARLPPQSWAFDQAYRTSLEYYLALLDAEQRNDGPFDIIEFPIMAAGPAPQSRQSAPVWRFKIL